METYYLRARYYNPAIGRLITEDSFWGKANDSLSLNLYVYCANNPIIFIDPSGHVMEGDLEKYGADSWVFSELVRLGDLWWEADAAGNQAEKDRLHTIANDIRERANDELAYLANYHSDSNRVSMNNCYNFCFIY